MSSIHPIRKKRSEFGGRNPSNSFLRAQALELAEL